MSYHFSIYLRQMKVLRPNGVQLAVKYFVQFRMAWYNEDDNNSNDNNGNGRRDNKSNGKKKYNDNSTNNNDF